MICNIVVFLCIAIFADAYLAPPSFLTRHKSSFSMALKVGDGVPNVVFKCRVRDESLPQPNPFKWRDVSSADLFKGKRCVLFALPGG